jgi:hypothetical protein
MRTLVFAVLCAAFAVACSDQSTAPNAGTPDLRAAQGDRSEWTVQWSWPATPPEAMYLVGHIPCINGGAGEDVLGWGPEGSFSAKAVVTPSGNTNYNGYYVDGGDGIEHYVGAITGDDWVSAPYAWNGKTEYTMLANGIWKAMEPAWIVLTNARTGERVRVLWQWRYHFGQDGSTVGNERNGEIISCHAFAN